MLLVTGVCSCMHVALAVEGLDWLVVVEPSRRPPPPLRGAPSLGVRDVSLCLCPLCQPENILLSDPTEEALIKIADFGFAKVDKGNARALQTACGTPGYGTRIHCSAPRSPGEAVRVPARQP
jgi:hypothetical protein